MPLHYENAVPTDSALLTQTATVSKKNWGYPDEMMALWQTDLEITEAYINANTVVKVFDSGIFIGFYALVLGESHNAEIDHFWLLPEYHKKGFGSLIFQQIIDQLRKKKYATVTVLAEPNAKGFYEKMGGTIIGRIETKIIGRFLDVYGYHVL